jgi:REP element-mobilizing transposase RayT
MAITNDKIKHQTALAGGDSPARHKRKHLRRLEQIFERHRTPLYYLTICVENRPPVLATQSIHDILFQAWKDAKVVHGWLAGRYVVMPDHVHFFCSPHAENKKDLSEFIGDWKNWTQLQINKPRLFYFDWQEDFSIIYCAALNHIMKNGITCAIIRSVKSWLPNRKIGPTRARYTNSNGECIAHRYIFDAHRRATAHPPYKKPNFKLQNIARINRGTTCSVPRPNPTYPR